MTNIHINIAFRLPKDWSDTYIDSICHCWKTGQPSMTEAKEACWNVSRVHWTGHYVPEQLAVAKVQVTKLQAGLNKGLSPACTRTHTHTHTHTHTQSLHTNLSALPLSISHIFNLPLSLPLPVDNRFVFLLVYAFSLFTCASLYVSISMCLCQDVCVCEIC